MRPKNGRATKALKLIELILIFEKKKKGTGL